MKRHYLNHVLTVCKKIYPLSFRIDVIPQLANDPDQFVRKNRLEPGKQEYEKFIVLVKRNIANLEKYVPKDSFALIKTFSSYPHVTHDIDVVVKKTNLGTLKHTLDERLGAENIIDLHDHVSWTDSPEVSTDFFWNHLAIHKMGCLVPDETLDALIRIAHIPFETGMIRFGELLHIYRQLKLADPDVLEKEAARCGWPKTFHRMTRVLSQLHEVLFTTGSTSVHFPYRVSLSVLAGAVLEKHAWKKLWGARYILKERLGL